VTLRLQNVPWDQALDIVLRTKGLDKRRNDNVIIVAPTEELASREKAELAAHADVQDLAPLRSEYLQVNYAKASDLANLIKSQAGCQRHRACCPKRGTVSVDDRTNTCCCRIRRIAWMTSVAWLARSTFRFRQVQIERRAS
jgi:type IV pilus assembly protein PilQ